MRWAQATTHGVSLHYVPVDVAEQLGALVEAHTSAWICTSATLAVGDSFDHFMRRLGMREAHDRAVRQPVQLRAPDVAVSAARARIRRHRRDTRSRSSMPRCPVLRAAGGRAFLLFTSHRALRDAAEILLRRLGATLPFPVLVQGDGAARVAAVASFANTATPCCSGPAASGKASTSRARRSRVVVIDKLPFAAPDDPVLKARLDAIERRGGSPFFEEQIPQAVIALKQGVGRLMRDPNDFGVVMLCDQRLRTRALRPDLPREPAADAAHRAARGSRAVPVREARSRRHRRAAGAAPGRAMKLLAIDTATERCSVALLVDERIIERASGNAARTRGSACCRWSMKCSPRPGCTLRAARRSRVRTRPGAFTGVRIAVGVAQGLAYGAQLATVGISNLAAVAQQFAVPGRADPRLHGCAHERGVLVPVRRRRPTGSCSATATERVDRPEAVEAADATVFAGTGFGAYPQLAAGDAPDRRFTAAVLPHAREIARLAAVGVACGARRSRRARSARLSARPGRDRQAAVTCAAAVGAGSSCGCNNPLL